MIANDSTCHSRLAGTVRNAETRDLAELGRLFKSADFDARALHAQAQRSCGHLLVLDVDGSLRAAVYVVIEPAGPRGRLQMLIVDAVVTTDRKVIEDRMLGVALALCDAYACVEVEIAASGQIRVAA